MKAVATVLLGALVALSALHARADEPQLAPYVADYDVKYGSMSVGSSRMELRRTGVPGQWQLQSRTRWAFRFPFSQPSSRETRAAEYRRAPDRNSLPKSGIEAPVSMSKRKLINGS